MGTIKNKALNKAEGVEKKFTLTELQINTLMEYRNVAQQQLDRMLQEMTTVYLHEIAVDKFGYQANSNLGFALDLKSSSDNITITEIT